MTQHKHHHFKSKKIDNLYHYIRNLQAYVLLSKIMLTTFGKLNKDPKGTARKVGTYLKRHPTKSIFVLGLVSYLIYKFRHHD